MQKIILKIDGIILVTMGAVAAIADLASYFFGRGPFGPLFFQKSIAIGSFEAHFLAIISGIILICKSKSSDAIFFSKAAVAIHMGLGISNLIWFRMFAETGSVPMGYLTTIAHFVFVVFHITAIYKDKKNMSLSINELVKRAGTL